MFSKLGSSAALFTPLNHAGVSGGEGSFQQKAADSSDPTIQTYHANLDSKTDLQAVLNSPDTLSVERDCLIRSMALPNDPNVDKNFGLQTIRSAQAWSIVKDTSVIVAVSDTGIDLQHPDLKANLWQNLRELNGVPGVDDDNNGFIDDIDGWGFAEKSNDPTPGTYEGAEHGTHVAGIVGAVGNNGYGSAGVAWSVKLMPLRSFSKTSNDAALSDLIASVYYAANNGAQILNCSWGSEQKPSNAELDAFNYAESKGVFVVAAAGNEARDTSLYTPASIATVFSVGSINSKRELSTFSSYGNKIGILAPGGDVISPFGTGLDEQIYSTVPGSGFDYKKGTSVSAPFVAGVAALVKSLLPKISPSNLRILIKESGDLVHFRTFGIEYTYSILNAEKAVSSAHNISRVDPGCSDNCIQSGSFDLSSSGAPSLTKFGGGCAMNKAQLSFKSASSGPWDFALIFSSLLPSLMSALQKLRASGNSNAKKTPRLF